ncbi:hypothetical protein ACX3VT_01495 [Aerococcus sanguinicola]
MLETNQRPTCIIIKEEDLTLILARIQNLEENFTQLQASQKKAYLSQKEILDEFKIGHRRLKRWVAQGLQEIWIENRVYYDREDLKNYLSLHKV